MEMAQNNQHVSHYFSKPAALPKKTGQLQQPPPPPLNANRGIRMMTVSRRPNEQGRFQPNATMQFNGISNRANECSSSIPMETANNTAKMETDPVKSHRELTSMEKQRFLTGTIDKVIKWHRIMNDFCLFEVIGPIVSIQDGTHQLQKIILMRDKKGPVLKVVHYSSDRIHLPNFHIGQIIRCVGKMISSNTLHAFLITEATTQEISTLPRFTAKCDQEIMYYQRHNSNN